MSAQGVDKRLIKLMYIIVIIIITCRTADDFSFIPTFRRVKLASFNCSWYLLSWVNLRLYVYWMFWSEPTRLWLYYPALAFETLAFVTLACVTLACETSAFVILACGTLACVTLACVTLACGIWACGTLACGILACGILACGTVTCGILACGTLACGIWTYGTSVCGKTWRPVFGLFPQDIICDALNAEAALGIVTIPSWRVIIYEDLAANYTLSRNNRSDLAVNALLLYFLTFITRQ